MTLALAMKSPEPSLLEQVMGSDLLGNNEKAVYKIIYECGPLTHEAISDRTGILSPWSYISKLKSRGMITKANDFSYTSNGVKSQAFIVTNTPPTSSPMVVKRRLNSVSKPTPGEISVFCTELAVLLALSHSKGARISLTTKKVQKWLVSGAECQCASTKSNNRNDLNKIAKKFVRTKKSK